MDALRRHQSLKEFSSSRSGLLTFPIGQIDDNARRSSAPDTEHSLTDSVSNFDDENTPPRPPVSRDDKQQRQESSTSEANEFLAQYRGVDPLVALHEYYQQQNKTQQPDTGIKQLFTDYQQNNSQGQISWRSVFTEPVSGKRYHSSLPVPALPELSGDRGASAHIMSCDNGEGISKTLTTMFGGYELIGGDVYFRTKKGARKSAALTALEDMNWRTDGGRARKRVMFRSISEAQATGSSGSHGPETRRGGLDENQEQSDNVTPSSKAWKPKRRHHIPVWAKRLFEMGVDSSSVTIVFREYLSPARIGRVGFCKLSKSYPTLLCCIISITLPISLTVVGLPCQSKRSTLSSAVDLIEEEIRRQLSIDALNRHAEQRRRRILSQGDASAAEWESNEKGRLLSCVPPTVKYVYPLQPWANTPIVHFSMTGPTASFKGREGPIVAHDFREGEGTVSYSGHSTGDARLNPSTFKGGMYAEKSLGADSTSVFLYELVFLTASGNPYVVQRMGLEESCATRLGVVFAKDVINAQDLSSQQENVAFLNDSNNVVETSFVIPGKGMAKDETVTVRLSNRKVIDLRREDHGGGDENCVSDRIEMMKEFNRTINNWKMYGFNHGITANKKFFGTRRRKTTGKKRLTVENSHEIAGGGGSEVAVGAMERTYLFVPLCQSTTKTPGTSQENAVKARTKTEDIAETAIDWNVIRHVYNKHATPYLVHIDRTWYLPVFGRLSCFSVGWTFLTLALVAVAPALSNTITLYVVGVKSPNGVVPRAVSFLRLETLEKWELVLALISLVAATIIFLLGLLVPPKRTLSDSMLKNRFLVQRKPARNALYVFHHEIGQKSSTTNEKWRSCDLKQREVTARSSLFSPAGGDALSPHKRERFLHEYNLDLATATFADYYLKRYGVKLSYPSEKMVPVHLVKKNTDHDALASQGRCLAHPTTSACNEEEANGKSDQRLSSHADLQYLVPELIFILPMPRDVLYLCKHACLFMEPLERVLELSNFAQELRDSCKSVESRMHLSALSASGTLQPLVTTHDKVETRSLLSLLREATTMTPCVTYQRLEFLGDAVLTFFVSINVMARNSSLKWDFDDLGNIVADAGKNKVLIDAALRIGLNRIIFSKARKWQSAYKVANGHNDTRGDCGSDTNCVLLDYDKDHHCDELSDQNLGDIVESLLAVAFLEGCKVDTDRGSSSMVLALLDELELPLPEQEGKSVEAGWPWFRAMGPCIRQGYPFDIDKTWKQELINLGTTLYCQHDIIDLLEDGWKKLVALLTGLATAVRLSSSSSVASSSAKAQTSPPSVVSQLLSSQRGKILLLCALFDDSLGYGEDGSGSLSSRRSSFTGSFDGTLKSVETASSSERTGDSITGLYRVALLRDTLFLVGNSALFLTLSKDFYRRYPHATAGEMHLLLTCAITDDALVYIMVKNGIHNFLYDKPSKSAEVFMSNMALADAAGSDVWEERGGWIVPGGVEEFRRRCTVRISEDDNDQTRVYPRYVGLAGGRLRMQESKLSPGITEDLAFSMKSIAGALTLSLGMDGMWQCLGPLFEEIMLLSPDELRREYSSISSICQSYQKGHESTIATAFR